MSTVDELLSEMSHDEDERVDVRPVLAGSLKKGQYCMMKGNPCLITDLSCSKPGKHGACKICLTGTDLFTRKKYEEIFPSDSRVWVPVVAKIEYEVANITDDGNLELINPDFTLKVDVKLDRSNRNEMTAFWEKNNEDSQVFMTVLSACGQEKVVAIRTKQH